MATLVVGSEGLLLEPFGAALKDSLGEVYCLGRHRHDPMIALGGDPAAIDFGLSGEEYLRLVRSVDRVILAEVPDRTRAQDMSSLSHVRAAEEVLEFVRAGGGRSQVVCLSSLLLFGSGATRVSESDFRVGQSFDSPFEQSLALAEQAVRRVAEYGVPLCLLRVAPLVGDSQKGILDRSSPLYELIELVRSHIIKADGPWSGSSVHFETHDHAASALARLARAGGTRTAHLVRGSTPTDQELCEWIRETLHVPPFREERIGSLIRRPPLLGMRSPDRRALIGWALDFGSQEASALGLLNAVHWQEVLRPILRSELDREQSPAPFSGTS